MLGENGLIFMLVSALGRQEGWPLTSPEHYLDKQYSLKTFWYRKLPILSLPDSRIPF